MLLFKRKGIKGKTYIPSKPISWDSVICSFECDYLGTVNISLMRDFTVHFCLDQLTPIFTQYRAKKKLLSAFELFLHRHSCGVCCNSQVSFRAPSCRFLGCPQLRPQLRRWRQVRPLRLWAGKPTRPSWCSSVFLWVLVHHQTGVPGERRTETNWVKLTFRDLCD